uniref:Fibropellin-1-like n=1 Tax=Crassostrea virginica TaxID=6565 RepID=A0A8B8AYD4_CRAVI|nr:fibropellin-1-like [Crassostrea virginica]
MPISTVVLQFLVKTPPLTVSCNDKPSFVSPTRRHGSVIHTDILQAVNLSFYASGSREIIGIDVTTPAGMTYTPLQNDSSRIGTKFLKATWTPQQHQVGSHITCALAEDVLGKTSDSRCIKIIVRDVSPCVSSPCGNRGTCVRQAITQNYMCTCRQGYTGSICQTDINECASGPCLNYGTCQDHVNGFTCLCVIGFTGRYCETDIDECASNPCQNNGTCLDAVNQFSCVCVSGFTDQRCQKDVDECAL